MDSFKYKAEDILKKVLAKVWKCRILSALEIKPKKEQLSVLI